MSYPLTLPVPTGNTTRWQPVDTHVFSPDHYACSKAFVANTDPGSDYNFIDGAYVSLSNADDDVEYRIEFIDKNSNDIIYNTTLKNRYL